MVDGSGEPLIEIDIPSSVDMVTVVRMVVAAVATARGSLDGDRLDDLRWVTSEATTNAIQANQRRADDEEMPATPRVHMQCAPGSDFVALTVVDGGNGIDDAPEIPEITHPDRLLIEGGFGVPLMKELTRGAMEYITGPDGTTLELRVQR